MRKAPLSRKEWLTLVITMLVLIVAVSATGIYFRNRDRRPAPNDEQMVIVEGQLPSATTNNAEKPEEPPVTLGSTTFFITPSATELLTALRESSLIEEDPEVYGERPLQVIWPGFFFSLQHDSSGRSVALLDVDESGFGTILRCLVDLEQYPELLTLDPGKKIWVAGQIIAVDLAGDGIVTIDVQYIRFDDTPPAPNDSSPPP